MTDPAALGPISEGMRVECSDGKLFGTVRTVWGGMTDLDSSREMEAEVGTGPGVVEDPTLSELPEGTTPLGEPRPGYMEVEPAGGAGEDTLYVPLTDIADVTGERIVLHCTFEEGQTGRYSREPSEGS